MKKYNIFEYLVFDKDKEIEEIIYEDEKIKVIRTASFGQSTSYYDQEDLEIVKIEEGEAVLDLEGKEVNLKKGDILAIKPHKIHRVVKQNKVVWLCIFVK